VSTQHTPEERRAAISLSVTEDHMQAWVQVVEGFVPSAEDYREALNAAGIVAGIDESALVAMEANPPVYEAVCAAQGAHPTDGTNAEVEFLFATLKSPFVVPDDPDAPIAIDFKESKVLQHVGAGDVLARKTPATPGTSGFTVFGASLPAKSGTDVAFVAATNTAYSDDRTAILAKISGVPSLEKGNKVAVQAVLQAKNVDYASGNIHHIGSVKIEGDVLPGFRVEATGNIEVGGTVEGASLLAGGMVLIKGGIRNHANVEAVGDVFVKFVDSESSVKSQGSIQVAVDCIQSKLDAVECIVVGGQMSGGQAKAGVSIEAASAGSPREIPTRFEVLRNVSEGALLHAKDELARLEASATMPMRTQAAPPGSSLMPGKKPIGAPARPPIGGPPRVLAPPAARIVPPGGAPRPGPPPIVPRPPAGLAPNLRLPKPPQPAGSPSMPPRPGALLPKPSMAAPAGAGAPGRPPVPGLRLPSPVGVAPAGGPGAAPQTAGQMRRQVQDQVRHEWDVLSARRLVEYLTAEVGHPNVMRGRVLIRGEIHPGTTVGIHRMALDVSSKSLGRVYFAGDGFVKEAIAAMGHLGG
jgi:hypothetical protein